MIKYEFGDVLFRGYSESETEAVIARGIPEEIEAVLAACESIKPKNREFGVFAAAIGATDLAHDIFKSS